MKVKILPHLSQFADPGSESGIRRVIEAYFKYLPQFGVELVDADSDDYDVLDVHAGCVDDYRADEALVCSCHGMYWSADYDSPDWELHTNAKVIKSIRFAREVTVPSPWVAEAFQRDMHFSPHVIPHGIDWASWQHDYQPGNFVLWNKNRTGDVCDVDPVTQLATKFPEIRFVSTFKGQSLPNVQSTGVIPHAQMKELVQKCGVYLSTTKETFGIGVLEALAAGRPVLGYRHGGNIDLVEHGVNGYLAEPGNMNDLADGLMYCIEHQEVLGNNARQTARKWTWESACEKLAKVFESAMVVEPPTAAVIIPTYNYSHLVGTAISTALEQTYDQLVDVVVVDDGSHDHDAEQVVQKIKDGAEANLLEAQSEVDDISNQLDTLEKAIGEEEDEEQLATLKWDVPHVQQRLADARSKLEEAQEISNRASILTYIRQPNSGVAIARNTGIRATDAKYVACLDADDQMEPTFLETLVPPMEADQSLGIAYSGLKLLIPRDDKILEVPSGWPHECDFDKQVEGGNQVPTCCLFRRKAWERLGGYRQRYAPDGCGTEDAELWLRIGAYGWDIRQVTKEPLFRYLLGGQTTGDREYKEVNYLQWHPWVIDRQHPFASIATPARHSHRVRQYDEPLISIIIPVGPGHEFMLVDALDSLEAQVFRKWEAIVVDDTGDDKLDLTAFPFARVVKTPGKMGAGYARNRGVDVARAQLILFLDADDWIYPDTLWRMLEEYYAQGGETIIYPDQNGLAIISEEEAKKTEAEHRLLQYRPSDGHAVMRFFSQEYDWARAVRQPDRSGNFYIWCYISALVPKHWHYEIGGFDEVMPSWEDWDYWIRMARAGKCFIRISEPLLVYRFFTGQRRTTASADTEKGLQMARDLVQYMTDKYGGTQPMPCTGCGGRRKTMTSDYPSKITQMAQDGINSGQASSDSDWVRCEYLGVPHGNRSDHSVVGVTVFEHPLAGVPMIGRAGGWSIDYRYKKAGDTFLVHREDLDRAPNWFRAVELERKDFESTLPKTKAATPPTPKPLSETLEEGIQEAMTPGQISQAVEQLGGAPTLPPPVPIPTAEPPPETPEATTLPTPEITEKEAVQSTMVSVLSKEKLELLPGVTPNIAAQMEERGFTSYKDILALGVDGIKGFRGVGEVKAQVIIDSITVLLAQAQSSM